MKMPLPAALASRLAKRGLITGSGNKTGMKHNLKISSMCTQIKNCYFIVLFILN